MNNALEFISAYNAIDGKLRSMYRGKGSPQFSDLVRRCADANPTVERYEEELLSYAKLRNAIVHMSTEQIIAQPTDEVTAKIKKISELLCSPPKLSLVKRKKLVSLRAELTLKEAIRICSTSGFSSLPVYDGKRTIGILNNRRLVREIGRAIERGEDVDEFLLTPCGRILKEEDLYVYYKFLRENDTVQQAIDAFSENKKLMAVIVSDREGRIVNLLTASDLPALVAMLGD